MEILDTSKTRYTIDINNTLFPIPKKGRISKELTYFNVLPNKDLNSDNKFDVIFKFNDNSEFVLNELNFETFTKNTICRIKLPQYFPEVLDYDPNKMTSIKAIVSEYKYDVINYFRKMAKIIENGDTSRPLFTHLLYSGHRRVPDRKTPIYFRHETDLWVREDDFQEYFKDPENDISWDKFSCHLIMDNSANRKIKLY